MQCYNNNAYLFHSVINTWFNYIFVVQLKIKLIHISDWIGLSLGARAYIKHTARNLMLWNSCKFQAKRVLCLDREDPPILWALLSINSNPISACSVELFLKQEEENVITNTDFLSEIVYCFTFVLFPEMFNNCWDLLPSFE